MVIALVDLEVVEVKVDSNLTISIEVFDCLTHFQSFADSPYPRHLEPAITGYGIHEDKQKSIDLAIEALYYGMEEWDALNGFKNYN